MFCANCGAKGVEGGKFCKNCGRSISQDHENIIKQQNDEVISIPDSDHWLAAKLNNSIEQQKTRGNKSKKTEIKCGSCGYIGSPQRNRSIWAQVMIWLIFPLLPLVPLIYYVATAKYRCPTCHSTFVGILNKNGIYVDQKQGAKHPLLVILYILGGIAVIGIIASVILASLNASREKASDYGVPTQTNEPVLNHLSDNKIPLSSINKSIVNIICESTLDAEVSGGSGTMMTPDGLILTASHIFPQDEETVFVDPDYGCIVSIPDEYTGEASEIYWAQPIIVPGLSDLYDVAFMEIIDVYQDEDGYIYGKYPNTFHSFWYSDEYEKVCTNDNLDIYLGDHIRVLGYPTTSGGNQLTITEGVISALDQDGYYLTTAKIDSGNSGGIAVNEYGCVVGMPIAVVEGNYQNLGAIIPPDMITDFIDMLNIYIN